MYIIPGGKKNVPILSYLLNLTTDLRIADTELSEFYLAFSQIIT